MDQFFCLIGHTMDLFQMASEDEFVVHVSINCVYVPKTGAGRGAAGQE